MSINPAVIASAGRNSLRRGMKTLPRALLDASCGLSRIAGSNDATARTDTTGATDGRFIAVEPDVDVETLRRALASGTTAIALAGCRTGADIQRLSVLLSVAEAQEDMPDGSIAIVAMTDGILPAPVSHQGFSGKSARLAALVWDQRALEGNLGAARPRTEDGNWSIPFATARAAVLLTAAAAGVPAYDTASALAGDGFIEDCRRSRADGFFGRVAAKERQIAVIEHIYATGVEP